jgi:hypothetical protein
VRGGVVSDVVEVPAAENILDMSTRSDDFHHEEMYSHPDTFRYAFQPAERTPPLELLLLSSSRHVDLESSIDRSPKSRQRTFGQFTPFLDLTISQIPPLKVYRKGPTLSCIAFRLSSIDPAFAAD